MDRNEVDGGGPTAAGPVCGSCGTSSSPAANFCSECGARLTHASGAAEYKQVTVLFADVVGSMKLAAELPAEQLRDIMNELFNRASAAVQRYQGTVDKFTGDGLMALFGAPVALEDHALRACTAAAEIQAVTRRFADEVARRHGVRLQLRVGLNSGQVIAGAIGSGPGTYTAVGHPVGMAQRMESAASAGGVLCSMSTARLVEESARLGPVEAVLIKGVDEPVPARRLLAVESDRMVLGRNEGAMIGRDADLRCLLELLQTGRSRSVGVMGAPGVGKSRLIAEFGTVASRLGAQIVLARCGSHTTNLAFRAMARLLRALFAVDGLGAPEARTHTLDRLDGVLAADSADAQILFEVMGIADSEAPPLEVSVDGRRRRLVSVITEALRVRGEQVVFVLEDVHWIDPPSDEVLADLSDALKGTSASFVTTYRPEYHGALQQCSDEMIKLRPLADAVALRVVVQLVGTDASLTALVDRIVVAAAGNPFFVEEIVRDLADRGVIAGSRGAYRLVDGATDIRVPATVQAVLAARIDRLPSQAKAIVNAAAVIGIRFDLDTLQALYPGAMSSALADLVSAELVDQTEFLPRQRYCFRHPLVRTVAYESQLSATRAQAHRRLASAIEARDPAAVDENAALIATHLESAGLLAEAYHWHMRAAGWLRPRDLPAARDQWLSARRLSDQLPDDLEDVAAMRIAPRTMLISTESFVGIDPDGDEQYRELRELALSVGDLRSLAIATAGRIMSFTFNQARVPEAAALAAELDDVLRQMDWDAVPEIDIVLVAMVRAYHANGEFNAALAVIDAMVARPHDEPTLDFAGTYTFRGAIELCQGNHDSGRRHVEEGLQYARNLPPVGYAIILSFWSLLVVLGLYEPGELIDEMREALRRAESFGDICGIITAQFAYGAALLRTDETAREEAVEVLGKARASIVKHEVMTTNLLPAIAADLAIDAARNGRLDRAIDDLRAVFAVHFDGGVRAELGCAGEALVGLLIERGDDEDLAEAHRIIDDWEARRPGIPAADLWWLKARAVLAAAEGAADRYAELANEYLELCEKLDARRLLAEARQMAGKLIQPR
ncbi:MAG: adenylyl cyclase [Mycolicibacterium sp.]|uniref:adenylate/guanylate cyclase domain-containing protein n=1 Tax=Mycolicibacterium sp. TaxID=2320850 RepID=UPI000F967686|nr:adenylate/guanylate cyclase domain-containing protein [Mycolicibacterium sp.]RUP31249.1 MAG: adenylyl cyclase [Mycolicibacterium sp.]